MGIFIWEILLKIMTGIFINYRRDDTPGVSGRLFDRLAVKYPRGDLFIDVDAMKPGLDFVKQLDDHVSHCQVLIAVIGPRWLDAIDRDGHRRLDSDKDYVRIELASALKRDIPVVPVLVDGAAMRSAVSIRAANCENDATQCCSDRNAARRRPLFAPTPRLLLPEACV